MNEDSLRIASQNGGSSFLLEATQFFHQPLERVFEFFADATRLESITPPWLHFSVLTPTPIRLVAGTHIDYRLRLHGIPLRWQSVIEVWQPPVCFVDRQTRGPYTLWRHEHQFYRGRGGTLCSDLVEYSVFGGRLIDAWLVRPELIKIFAFRQAKLREHFG